jgi:hypothetical protein
MDRETSNLIGGMLTGAIGFLAILIFFGLSPKQIENKNKKEIVQRGFGEYYVNTNTVPPSVDFRWKE